MSAPKQSTTVAARPGVFALLYAGCVSYDVALAAELLSRQYEIKTATSDGDPLALTSGLPLSVHDAFTDIKLDSCKALLVPSGDVSSAINDVRFITVLKDAHAKGVFILAIGDAVKLLKAARISTPDLAARTEIYAVENNVIVARAEGSIDAAVELGARLGVVDGRFVTRTKDHYRGMLGRKIRALALALIRDGQGRYLLHKMFDNKLKQTFYRPVGGGIDFHEPARDAITREIREELGFEIIVDDLAQTFENIFMIEDLKGHEMVSVFRARFKDPSAYGLAELTITESGKTVATAVWRTPLEIHAEGSALYPVGIEKLFI